MLSKTVLIFVQFIDSSRDSFSGVTPPLQPVLGAPSPTTLCFGRSLAYLSQDIYHLHPCQSSPLLEVGDDTMYFLVWTKVYFFFNWRIIALQCCGGLCHTSMWTSHNYICIPPLLSLPPPKGICFNKWILCHKLCNLGACYTLGSC